MLTSEQKSHLKQLYGALTDRPLEPDDPYYVHFLEMDSPAGDPIAELATRIGWSESNSVSLLTGQRGSGKSTELRRLRRCLKDEGCSVFLCDMRDYMNLTTPVEITDFLVSIMGALSEAVYDVYKVNPSGHGYLERFVDWLQTEVKINELSIQSGAVGVKASLREDPSFKEILQQRLKGHVARLVKDAHTFVAEVVKLIREKSADQDKKVVLLIDSVEQIRGVGAEGAEEVYKSVENLFSGHAESLMIPMLHVVYTIPPYLTPLTPGLGRQLGGGMVCSLPSVHIRNRDGEPDSAGLWVMEKIITRRDQTWNEIFTSDQLRRMALNTGGDLRDFFRLIRQCLVKASNLRDACLPVSDQIIENTENHLRREMLPIAEEDKSWLKKIAASKDPELESVQKLPQLARFFDTHLVLNYRNGDDWYDIHPLLVEEIKG